MSDWGDDEPAAPSTDVESAVPALEPSASALVDGEAPDAETAPTLIYGNVAEFVRDYLRDLHRTGVDGVEVKWAAKFWDYRIALIRLDALWRAWEEMRLDPGTGTSAWLRDHFDHHMPILLSKTGPFRYAPEEPENKADDGEPLPWIDPPEGMFPDEREQA